MSELNIISLNVNGLNNRVKREKILLQMEKEKGDIICLQETHLQKQEHEKLKSKTKSQVYFSSYNSSQKGVAIIIKPQVGFEIENCVIDKEGRYVLVVGKVEGREFTIFNVYYPPDSGTEFMLHLIEILTTKSKGVLIMAGDFNLVMNPKLDSSSNKMHRAEKNASVLRKFSSEVGLIDVWRALNPGKKEYTCYSGRHSVYNRLDYFFMLKNNITLVKRCRINAITLSDHAAVILTIITNPIKGKTLWRLNNSLLQDKEFVDRIKKVLKDYVELNDHEDVDPTLLWEGAKAVVRGHIISYASSKKRARDAQEKSLTAEIKKIEIRHSKTNRSEDNTELKEKRLKLDRLCALEIEKLMKLTHQEHYDGGPKSLKILAYKLKKQTTRAYITKLKTKDDKLITDKEEIAEEFANYYEELYREEVRENTEALQKYLRKIEMPKLIKENNKELVKEITAEEINKQIQDLKIGKTPGDDGFTNEFYKVFKSELIPLLNKAYNYALHTGKWAQTWTTSIITLILKEGKDATKCASYRPISLLNTDHKIISAILANRLKQNIIELINTDQCGFIPGRLLVDNIRRTINIIDYVQRQNKDICLITLDAEKAFDLVSWPFMFEVLKKIGLDETVCSWLKAIYTNPTSRIKTNGTISRKIKIQRGTRQGDPLSPLLFAIYIEVLAVAIRQNTGIKGIQIGKDVHKVALYADDIIAYLDEPKQSLQELKKVIQEYSKYSGYKLNENKCDALLIGKDFKQEVEDCFHFKSTQKIKYLGIYVSKNLEELYANNYGVLEYKVKQDLNRWKIIPEGLLGRIETIKMMVLPQFIFLFQALPLVILESQFKEWNKMISNFIWNNKKHRIKLKSLTQQREEGGLAVPNIENYFYATQIQIIMKWMNKEVDTKWIKIERDLSTLSLGTLPFVGSKIQKLHSRHNFCISNTIGNWKKICKKKSNKR